VVTFTSGYRRLGVSKQWQRRVESDNKGKPLDVWSWGDYQFSENVNLGDEGGGWVFEILFRGRYLALAATLALAKKAAVGHDTALNGGPDAVQESVEAAS
jgi:hypothetical protein